MIERLNYLFCDVDIYDNYMVVVIKPGIHLTPKHNTVLVDIVNNYFKDRPFVYLTHRVNSYSVDPAIYLETSKIENLAGFGVIADAPLSGANAEVEKLFLDKPFEIFRSLEDAVEWAKQLV